MTGEGRLRAGRREKENRMETRETKRMGRDLGGQTVGRRLRDEKKVRD